MPTIDIGGLTAELPVDWNCQGMLTLTLPSNDKRVKPNVILTKEFLPQPLELTDYFAKIKESIQKRGIQDLKISNERDLVVSGVKGKMMICQWDVAQMAKMMGNQKGQDLSHIQPGQIVKQVQVTLLKGQMAINMTASFPADQFDTYYKPFQEFLKSMKIA
ncbi:MAG: hypothetical protein A2W61_02025 [Deltaproteobacteria bacterium RIFCSPLOWO2_01_44_7]|nr:MAG: hypothetical protein A2712_01680 [Deltaproteobacteria bacterium RIFCSPHIGHO2_01_FULL_43_49]OGQ15162.1 MAG: hypothetical protein A3D22_03795 [Deltaproteobacteria bacterium RIFCSPHIGHO2_02_FULL_44_53]OGQ27217.1 MAG: hypothetical protein A3D98_02275 [Deltaproteobacteria bacterium RIFCSPHIGHO2_12_FULL_44_21]OGQ31679.1 MAG: hypothetical protein A2979_04955 [Deltaproteobacteria bacterium RIFCSPLOWO2_01_FULL_45_74]OGQ38550.1 MAG: hypothetical protein A2W61_02025 [Deltaproteobacteria bacterium 